MLFWLCWGGYHRAQTYPKPSLVGLVFPQARSWLECIRLHGPFATCSVILRLPGTPRLGGRFLDDAFTLLSYGSSSFQKYEKKEVKRSKARACCFPPVSCELCCFSTSFAVTFSESSSDLPALPTDGLPSSSGTHWPSEDRNRALSPYPG